MDLTFINKQISIMGNKVLIKLSNIISGPKSNVSYWAERVIYLFIISEAHAKYVRNGNMFVIRT